MEIFLSLSLSKVCTVIAMKIVLQFRDELQS